MNKLLITFLLSVAFFISCKKTETDHPAPSMAGEESQSFSWNHTPGSYYVYQWYNIDGQGGETPYGAPDSNIVVGDTMINGHTYTTFKTDHIIFNYDEMYWRDSSGYIVDQGGNIHFSYTAFHDTVQETDIASWFTTHHILGAPDLQISVPAGEFDVYHKRYAYEFFEGVAPVPCTQPLGHDFYFDANTGIPIIQQSSMGASYFSTCSYFERRLIEYHIEE